MGLNGRWKAGTGAAVRDDLREQRVETEDSSKEEEARTQRSAGPSGRGRLTRGGPMILVTGEAPPILCYVHCHVAVGVSCDANYGIS